MSKKKNGHSENIKFRISRIHNNSAIENTSNISGNINDLNTSALIITNSKHNNNNNSNNNSLNNSFRKNNNNNNKYINYSVF